MSEQATNSTDPSGPKAGDVTGPAGNAAQVAPVPALHYAPRPATRITRLRRWVPTREQVIGSLKTLMWVVPLTILIWIWAEREQTATMTNITFPIEIITDAPDRIVTIRDERNIVVDLFGPRAALNKAENQRLETLASGKRFQIIVPKDELPADRGDVQIAARLASQKIFRDNAVSVKKCFPTFVKVEVDQLVRMILPVEASPADQRQGAIAIKAEPVEVVGPRSVFDQAIVDPRYSVEDPQRAGQRRLVVFADSAQLRSLPPGRSQRTLDIHFPVPDPRFSLPPRVDAEIEVKPSESDLYKLNSLPVFLEAPKQIIDNYRIEYDPVVKNVNVTGPKEKVALLRDDAFVPSAVLRLTLDDRQILNVEHRRKLTVGDFHLPEGVNMAEGEEHEVTFKLILRPRDGG